MCENLVPLVAFPVIAIHRSLTGDFYALQATYVEENLSLLVITVRNFQFPPLNFHNIKVAAQ